MAGDTQGYFLVPYPRTTKFVAKISTQKSLKQFNRYSGDVDPGEEDAATDVRELQQPQDGEPHQTAAGQVSLSS
jgi:hypothetical protein